VSVACTLQVFWALVHKQVSMLHRCVFTPTYTFANTLAAGCAHMCICIYVCICMHMHIDAYMRLWYLLDALRCCCKDFLSAHTCAYACVCICLRMYVCIVHMYMCVYSYMYVCVYVCIYIYIRARVGVHMHSCRRIFFCLYCPISLLHASVSQVFLNTCMRVCGGIGSGVCFSLFMVSACYWRGRLCFGWGTDRGFVL